MGIELSGIGGGREVMGEFAQATGPPRSDAGVGIGMLRGISLLSAN